MRGRAALALAVTLGAAALAGAAPADPGQHARVARIVDGDTIELVGGARVRFVQIDTPELGSGECYSRAAARVLSRMLPVGSTVVLEADPALDQVDAYGRLLRYVWYRGQNLNVQLVRLGAATVWLYHGDRGRYADRLLALARRAPLGAPRPLGRVPAGGLGPVRPGDDRTERPAGALQGRLRPRLPGRLHPAAATRSRLQGHPLPALPRARRPTRTTSTATTTAGAARNDYYNDHMTRKMSATEAKAKILALLDEVAEGDEVEITKYGRTVARLVPAAGPQALKGALAGVAMTAVSDDELFSTGEAWNLP